MKFQQQQRVALHINVSIELTRVIPIDVDPVRVRNNKLVVRVLYGLDCHNNVTTE